MDRAGLDERERVGRELRVVLPTLESAAAHESEQAAAVEPGGELDRVPIGEWLGSVEARPPERARARVGRVQDERKEVEVEFEGTTKPLRGNDGAGATAVEACPPGAPARPAEERAPKLRRMADRAL